MDASKMKGKIQSLYVTAFCCFVTGYVAGAATMRAHLQPDLQIENLMIVLGFCLAVLTLWVMSQLIDAIKKEVPHE